MLHLQNALFGIRVDTCLTDRQAPPNWPPPPRTAPSS